MTYWGALTDLAQWQEHAQRLSKGQLVDVGRHLQTGQWDDDPGKA